MTEVLLIEDELVEHICALHEDVVVGSWEKVTPGDRIRLVLLCNEIRTAEAHARWLQLSLERSRRDDEVHHDELGTAEGFRVRSHRTKRLDTDLAAMKRWLDRHREDMRRMLACEPFPPSPLDKHGLWGK